LRFLLTKTVIMGPSILSASAKPQSQAAQAGKLAEKYWFRAIILVLAVHIIFSKDISIELNLSAAGPAFSTAGNAGQDRVGEERMGVLPAALEEVGAEPRPEAKKLHKGKKYANLAFVLNPGYAKRHGVPQSIVEEKTAICLDYIDRYAPVAKSHMKKFGVPASITLAQGLLESDAGKSKLAQESNNHFGIKCRRKCRGCTCRNYADDDVYDMFRVFDSPVESFQEHSALLNSPRYKHLLELKITDYNGWARGLKKAGYATDARYAEKLIRIIEALELYRYDRQA
jgi:flagellum-specific peptidoglycan hydrolase FlgJ